MGLRAEDGAVDEHGRQPRPRLGPWWRDHGFMAHACAMRRAVVEGAPAPCLLYLGALAAARENVPLFTCALDCGYIMHVWMLFGRVCAGAAIRF